MLSTSMQNSEEGGDFTNLARTFNSNRSTDEANETLSPSRITAGLNMTGGKSGKNKILLEMSKGFNATGKTSGLRGRSNRSPDNEDAVLIDDGSSDGSSKEKGKMRRFTPKN